LIDKMLIDGQFRTAWARSTLPITRSRLLVVGSASGGRYGGNGNVRVREKATYDGVKEEMSIMSVADADTARSGLLRSHGFGRRARAD
jgi:hypothetical protein